MTTYYKISDDTLTDIANAIREKNIDVDTKLIGADFAPAIRSIVTSYAPREIVEGGKEIIDTEGVIRKIRPYGFYSSPVETVIIPGCSYIDSYAFSQCYSLKKVIAENCTYINDNVFVNLANIEEVWLGECNCGSLFRAKSKLRILSGAITGLGGSACDGCYALTEVNLPNLKTIGNYAFRECSVLTTINAPHVKTIGGSAFYYTRALSTLSFCECNTFYNSAFLACFGLMSFYTSKYLSTDNTWKVPSIYNYTFEACPIASTSYTGNYGSIYVPAKDVSDFRRTQYWTSVAARIVGYDFETDTVITDDINPYL